MKGPSLQSCYTVIEPVWRRGYRTPRTTTRATALAHPRGHGKEDSFMGRPAAATHTSTSSLFNFPGGMMLDLIKKGTLAVTAVASIAVCSTANAWTAPDFPRIGGVQYGSPMNFNDPTYQANLAKQDVMLLADWPGMAPGGKSMQTNIAAIKA